MNIEPEFVVTRRDSLGMASKEYTQKIVGKNGEETDKIKSFASRHLSTDNEVSESGERVSTQFLHGTFNPAQDPEMVR